MEDNPRKYKGLNTTIFTSPSGASKLLGQGGKKKKHHHMFTETVWWSSALKWRICHVEQRKSCFLSHFKKLRTWIFVGIECACQKQSYWDKLVECKLFCCHKDSLLWGDIDIDVCFFLTAVTAIVSLCIRLLVYLTSSQYDNLNIYNPLSYYNIINYSCFNIKNSQRTIPSARQSISSQLR